MQLNNIELVLRPVLTKMMMVLTGIMIIDKLSQFLRRNQGACIAKGRDVLTK